MKNTKTASGAHCVRSPTQSLRCTRNRKLSKSPYRKRVTSVLPTSTKVDDDSSDPTWVLNNMMRSTFCSSTTVLVRRNRRNPCTRLFSLNQDPLALAQKQRSKVEQWLVLDSNSKTPHFCLHIQDQRLSCDLQNDSDLVLSVTCWRSILTPAYHCMTCTASNDMSEIRKCELSSGTKDNFRMCLLNSLSLYQYLYSFMGCCHKQHC